MISRKEGAANRQVTRANGIAARSRKPRPSVAELQEQEEWSVGKTIAITIIGALFLYVFMWLAAAY